MRKDILAKEAVAFLSMAAMRFIENREARRTAAKTSTPREENIMYDEGGYVQNQAYHQQNNFLLNNNHQRSGRMNFIDDLKEKADLAKSIAGISKKLK